MLLLLAAITLMSLVAFVFLGTFQSAGVIQRAYELNAQDSAFIAAAEGIILTTT